MKNLRQKRGLINLLKDSLRKPLTYLSLAALPFTGCQMAQVTYMENVKANKETPLIAEAMAQHRNYLDDTMPTTMLGQWDLAYQGLVQVKDGFPLNPGMIASGVWGTVFHGINGFIVPVFYPFNSQSRDKIFADQEQSTIKPVPDALANTADFLISTPVGDTYRTFAGLFSIKSEPFIPRAWTKACYRAKSLVGLSESEKSQEEKINRIIKSEGYLAHFLPVVHHWASTAGREEYNGKEVVRHTSGRGISLRKEYLQGLDLERIMHQDKQLVVKEDAMNASIPPLHALFWYPARDAAIIVGIVGASSSAFEGGHGGAAEGITGSETGGPGGK